LRAGKPADYRQAIAENVYESLRETFNVPDNDFFATVDELEPHDFIYDRTYFYRAHRRSCAHSTDSEQHPHRRAEEGALRPHRRAAP
jgi:hypothetical protein